MLKESLWKIRKKIGDFEITCYNALFFEDEEKYIVAGDLHLGLEEALRLRGISLPKKSIKEIKEKLKKLRKIYGDDTNIILNGDLKHEFSELTYEEKEEILSLIEFIIERFNDVIVIKGNHDNFIINVLKRKNIPIYDYYQTPKFYITHGHLPINYKNINKNIVLSHEHPAITLYDDVGGSIKLDAYLVHKYKNKHIVVLPSFSTYTSGSDILKLGTHDVFSNILREISIDNFTVYGIYEDEILYLGKVKTLKELYANKHL